MSVEFVNPPSNAAPSVVTQNVTFPPTTSVPFSVSFTKTCSSVTLLPDLFTWLLFPATSATVTFDLSITGPENTEVLYVLFASVSLISKRNSFVLPISVGSKPWYVTEQSFAENVFVSVWLPATKNGPVLFSHSTHVTLSPSVSLTLIVKL